MDDLCRLSATAAVDLLRRRKVSPLELLDAAAARIDETEPILRMVERFVADAMVAVESDDTGLWEYRTFPNKYTFSHVLCWVAASRGAKLVRRLGRSELAGEWEAWAERYRQVILDRAYNADPA